MKDPKIEAIYLTSQEEEDAIYEGKVKKHFFQEFLLRNSTPVDIKANFEDIEKLINLNNMQR